MINYYQPYLLPFLRFRSYSIPEGLQRTYFVSFEDALWVLLKHHHVPKHSVILIPDFYCMDVVNNIKLHGYKPIFYPLDENFQITKLTLIRCIKKYAPRVIVLFHACGIPSAVANKPQKIFKDYPNIILIEDAVHRLIEPDTILLHHPNHYVIDSLRKVSPLPGSFLYSQWGQPAVLPDPRRREWRYYVAGILYFYLFRLIFMTGTMLRNAIFIAYAHEKILKAHDDIIGDSISGYPGYPLVDRLHKHIDFAKIRNSKASQVALYEQLLPRLIKKNPFWYQITIPNDAKDALHVFPIGFKHSNFSSIFRSIEVELHKNGVVVWFKFPDSPWSEKRGVLFLPLGFHINERDIRYIMKKLGTISHRLRV